MKMPHLSTLRAFLVPLALCAAFAVAEPAAAWEEATYPAVVDNALLLLPPPLREMLKAYREDILAGLEETRAKAPARSRYYYPEKDQGKLLETIEAEVRKARDMMAKQRPLPEVARQLGAVSFYATCLADPFQLKNTDPRGEDIALDFPVYVQRALPRIKPTFDGYDKGFLHGELKPFLIKQGNKSRARYDVLLAAYYPKGTRVSSTTFDDRSGAFGAASLCFSQCIGDTARLWVYFWYHSGGHMEGTPFLAPAEYMRKPSS